MQWFYVEGGKQAGPVDETKLEELVRAGTISANTYVWHDGMSDWVAYGKLPAPEPTPTPAGTEPAPAAAAPSRLTVAGSHHEPAAEPAAGAAARGTCRECGREFPLQDMIAYEGSTLCAECKPKFFQRLQEGAPAEAGGGGDGSTSNKDLMTRAREALEGKWGQAALFAFVLLVIFLPVFLIATAIGAVVPFAGNVVDLLLVPALTLGAVIFYLALSRRQDTELGMMWRGFSRYGTALGAYFVQNLIVGAVTLLAALPAIVLIIIAAVGAAAKQSSPNMTLMVLGVLLVFPAVVVAMIAQYTFALTFFIMADDPTAGAMDCLKRSHALMKGVKWKLFCLSCRFIGWGLLAMLTFFIGFLWLGPYIAVSYAAFYDDVRGRPVTE